MALKRRIGKSRTIPFQVTSADAVELVVIFSGEVSGTIYQRFSYPQRGDSDDVQDSSAEEEWELLDVDSTGHTFSGTLSEEATQGAEDDYLVVDIKGWDEVGNTEVKRCRLLPIVSTAVELVNLTN